MGKRKEILDIALNSLKSEHPLLIEKISFLENQREECLKMYRWILLGDPNKIIYNYHLFMQAILSKTINLLESFIVDIALQNIYSTTNILRSHYELLASLNYYLKNPDKRDQIMWGERYDKKKKDVKTKAINIITMLERLDEDTPKNWKVLEDYEEMSQIVHPNRKSNLASIREGSKDSGGQWSHFSSHSEMSESEISTYINAHLNLVNSILNLSKNFDDLFCKTNGIQKVEPTLKEKDE